MLFNSIQYLFLFLPIVVLGFYAIRFTSNSKLLNSWLVLSSLVFYGSWAPKYLLLIGFSVVVNFLIGQKIAKSAQGKFYLILGIVTNVSLLGYFKYAQFFVDNLTQLFGMQSSPILGIILPIGISFYTFQQISFLVDAYKTREMQYNFLDYMLFVTFFPQLIAGPIVYHKEMMPQFKDIYSRKVNWESIYVGLFLIALGLIKKMVIADTFGVWVNEGYDNAADLTMWTAWKTSLSYTMQLYYDFSGYMDMALGSARLFDIKLPLNFNSPYLAINIQDFWRRWHITLGRFLKNYIYVPLGGSRVSFPRICLNLFLTFLIGGIWHGAGWTFFLWGALHGLAIVVHRTALKLALNIPKPLAWIITFLFVNAAWVYFRAPDIQTANTVLLHMVDFSAHSMQLALNYVSHGSEPVISGYFIAMSLFIIQDHLYKNSHRWAEACKPSPAYSAFIAASLFIGALIIMSENMHSEFLYFQF